MVGDPPVIERSRRSFEPSDDGRMQRLGARGRRGRLDGAPDQLVPEGERASVVDQDAAVGALLDRRERRSRDGAQERRRDPPPDRRRRLERSARGRGETGGARERRLADRARRLVIRALEQLDHEERIAGGEAEHLLGVTPGRRGQLGHGGSGQSLRPDA